MVKRSIFTNITNKHPKESLKNKPLPFQLNFSKPKFKNQNLKSKSFFNLCKECTPPTKPVFSKEYHTDIYSNMLKYEKINNPLPNYIYHQKEIQWQKRATLIAWIAEVHNKLGLEKETFFLCVNLIDRFLSARSVNTESLQLIGLTCLFISSKYEEVVCVSIGTFAGITKKVSTKEILSSESYILHSLKSDIFFINPISYLRHFCYCKCEKEEIFELSYYILVRLYLDEVFIKYSASAKATTSYYLATKILKLECLVPTGEYEICIAEAVEVFKTPVLHCGVKMFCEQNSFTKVVEQYFFNQLQS